MRSTLLSFERRASRFAAVALVGATFVAACDDSRPTAPVATAAAPTKPSDARYVSTGTLVWKAVDVNAKLIGGATFQINGGPGQIQWVMPDNNAGDVDPVLGQFKFGGVKPGGYQVCEIVPPKGYMLPFAFCKNLLVTAGTITDFGSFVSDEFAWVSMGYVDYAKTPVGGGTYSVTDTLGIKIMSVVDNSALDVDKADGKFKFQLPYMGKFTICEEKAPPGWYFPVGQVSLCKQVAGNVNTDTNYGDNMVLPPYSAVWSVISGWTGPLGKSPLWLGPSTYTVSKTDNSFTWTFLDNGPGDLHNMLGIYYVKLPSAGTYNVCQAAEIPGYFLPNPVCHQVDVTFAKVGWGDFFLNQEKQVIYNP